MHCQSFHSTGTLLTICLTAVASDQLIFLFQGKPGMLACSCTCPSTPPYLHNTRGAPFLPGVAAMPRSACAAAGPQPPAASQPAAAQ